MAYTTIDDPGLYFNTVTWTGNDNESRDIDGVGFQPDWVWGKRRDDAAGHNLLDAVRGAGENGELQSNSNGAEGGGAQDRFGYLSAFLSDGFRVEDGSESSGDKAYWNQNNATYVAWCWKANGSGSSNTDGGVTSSISANQTAGFSIVTYTGTGSNTTVGHGLGVKPDFILFKKREGTSNWITYDSSNGATKYLHLNLTDNVASASTVHNDTEPTSSVFSIGTNSHVNTASGTYLAYCFAEKKGYSRISKYTGNGASGTAGHLDGPFVYCGFKPAWLLVKRLSGTTQGWYMWDNRRNGFNNNNFNLEANDSVADDTGNFRVDFYSTGFKWRVNDSIVNNSGTEYLFIAFAESPIVNSNGVPNNAE